MAFASTSAVLDSLKARIEALTPSTQIDGQAAEDDVFRVYCGIDPGAISGDRGILLIGTAGVRKPGANLTCHDWETQVEIASFYADVPPEAGQQSPMQRAITDAEDILADIYTWASETSGILAITPQPAAPQPAGDGALSITRTIGVLFQRA